MKLFRLLTGSSVAVLSLAAVPAIAGNIAGVVIDASETVALQSAVVRVPELGREVVTDRDGSYQITDLPEGSYTIEVDYIGAPVKRDTIDVPATGTVIANYSLGAQGDNQILVVGQAANQASSLSRKRAADGVSDVLSRDAIGQFPDQNVAESIRRLPGVNVLNDQGEGRFVSVRGLDPNLNATSFNGVRLPSPEGDVRGVALDVISSDIIESIEIKKSLTPDMDADTIGASIEIETTSAFDRRRNLLTAKLEGSYNNYADTLSPKGSVDFAYRLTDSIGVAGGVSYYQRDFETDNIEADNWSEDDGLVYAEELQYRDYDVERERISASLNFDFLISETTEFYVRGLYSEFNDQEYRRRTTFDLGDADVSGSGMLVEYSDASDKITVERDIKDRFETQRVRSITFGGETDTGTWFADYSASWAKSSENEDGSLDPVQFEREFEEEGLILGVDYGNQRRPSYSVLSDPTADFFNPEAYELKDIEVTDLSASQDEEFAGRIDLGRRFAAANGEFTVQGGFKGRWREKSYDKNASFYENDAFLLSDVLGEQTYRITDISPVASFSGPADYFSANFADFEFIDIDSQFESAIADYQIEEDILAGYLLGRWDSDTLRVIGGVRYEHTDNYIQGNSVLLVEEDGTLPDGTIAADDTVLVTPTVFDRDYRHWLPSLNIRFEPQTDLVFRLAGYRSLVRPGLSKLAPRFTIEESDDGEREGEFGNPDLKPYEAWNFDASAELYFNSNGAITAAVFYKDIKNFIVDAEFETGTFNGIAYDEAIIPINGESAEVFGVELGASQQFSFLPAPFDGLLLQANYTYTDASALVPNDGDPTDLREISLPSTSKHTINGVIGYEKGPLTLRLAGTFRDDYLDELGSEVEEDRMVDSHFQLDLSAKFQVTDNIQFFAEAVNLTDAEFFAYNTVGERQNAYQYEIYGRTFKGGVKVKF